MDPEQDVGNDFHSRAYERIQGPAYGTDSFREVTDLTTSLVIAYDVHKRLIHARFFQAQGLIRRNHAGMHGDH